jgi:hypothetical protein
MSDIVERLRDHFANIPEEIGSSTFDLVLEAADEIDRLREEIEVMILGDRLRAERDRLREALEQIANFHTDPALIARAALSTEKSAEAPTTDPSVSWSAREP